MTDPEADRLRRLMHEGPPEMPEVPGLAARARRRASRLRRARRATYAGVVAVVLAAVGVPLGFGLSGPARTPTPAHQGPPAVCPVTRPMAQQVVPATLRSLGSRWYGAGKVWVSLPPSDASQTSTGLKYGVFTLDSHGRMSDAAGPPGLTARRLDGRGKAKGDRLAPDNYASAAGPHGRTVHFWPTTINLPSAGCWQLTEELGNTTVRFVLRIGGPAKHCAATTCDTDAIRRAIQKPLRVPRLGPQGRCPVSEATRFDGGAGFTGAFIGLGRGPVYLAPVSQRKPGRLMLQRTRHPGWLWTKPIWVFGPSYSGPVLLRGKRVGGAGTVEFDRYLGSASSASNGHLGPKPSVLYPRNGLHATSSGGLESYPGGLYVRAPGCYAIQVDGLGFTEHIVFRAVGPAPRP